MLTVFRQQIQEQPESACGADAELESGGLKLQKWQIRYAAGTEVVRFPGAAGLPAEFSEFPTL